MWAMKKYFCCSRRIWNYQIWKPVNYLSENGEHWNPKSWTICKRLLWSFWLFKVYIRYETLKKINSPSWKASKDHLEERNSLKIQPNLLWDLLMCFCGFTLSFITFLITIVFISGRDDTSIYHNLDHSQKFGIIGQKLCK